MTPRNRIAGGAAELVATVACRVCGRVVDTAGLEGRPAAERRCPRCGANLAAEATRSDVTRDESRPDAPGVEPPPAARADWAVQPAGDDAGPAALRSAAAARLPERIAFLGFGLIGGSVALALRAARGTARLVAWTPAGRGPAAGATRGILDDVAPTAGEAVEGAGLIVLAGPPLAVIDSLGALGGPLRGALADGVTITDVASTKARVVEAAEAQQLPFVGGHPMAGRETTGVGAATADLFVDRPWVIVPGDRARPSDVDRVDALASAVGARPIQLGAREHDAAVAAVSHLPLVLAAALAEAVAAAPEGTATWPTARLLAATGWRDMTRLARGDPEMGGGILATNAEAVSDRLRAVRRALDAWIDVLDAGTDAGVLRDRLDAARAALDQDPES